MGLRRLPGVHRVLPAPGARARQHDVHAALERQDQLPALRHPQGRTGRAGQLPCAGATAGVRHQERAVRPVAGLRFSRRAPAGLPPG
ncbi:hypothetical protein SBRY_110027 [Actinacidiphila bryophytorum]|uniref:Uncharacterized protein n=1 Tax=Actinacidiphila bryophytorum TaxID=1436133 RepID=A0A9W4E2H7_9ACTN|nr:hypothetical protein SBRY_110027 [Actinacidiphila bryophytorum]